VIVFLQWLVRLLYRFRAYNAEVLKTPGPVLLLPNHVSWWDWILIGVCLDEDWKFVTSLESARTSWFHTRIMVNRRTFPIDLNSPYAVKHMAEYLQQGGRLVLFPEGRLSRTGSLMKLFDGTGFLLFKTNAKVITAYLRGAVRLPLSPNPGLKRWFPRVSVHFSRLLTPPDLHEQSVSDSRERLTDWLYSQMVEQQFETEMEFGPATLPQAINEALREAPGKIALQDSTMQRLNYRRLVIGATLLSKKWEHKLPPFTKRVGVLLPNVNAMPVVLLSLWAAGKVPAILNYTSGAAILLACSKVAELHQIITSRAFLEHLEIQEDVFRSAGIELILLEDVRPTIGRVSKLLAVISAFLRPALRFPSTQPDETAIILFTSGSEGIPKGVELTHLNLLANIRQMVSVVDLLESDRFFNALPLFHSFGLIIGLLLPLVRRVFVFLYLSPLHYRIVPSAFYNLDCTVLFGTNTFLLGYARKAHPYDFRSLRYLFAGAEKLQEKTSEIWMHKFGVRIIEGYGATECSPCVSANTPLRPQPNSVGRLLPGIEYRFEAVPGISDTEGGKAGRLFVRGPNIMRGYLNPEPNAQFQSLNGWYDTGDIARVDDHGFLQILGRLKRFAKISGEMVSLTAVEDALSGAFPHYGLKFAVAIVSRPDEEKGERLLAVTNEGRLTLEEVRNAIRARGLNNLAVPRDIQVVQEIPRLGSGKVNYRELDKLVGK
jgi:acyl-[acyl-carrier-protein]-phospholipid O-acyltransferase/long-chain-fatty-acid--[acyl-carrier-protein] ligase